MEEGGDECFSFAYPMGKTEFSKYLSLAEDTVAEVNTHYFPADVNITKLLRINSVTSFTKVGFQNKLFLTLVQTNCTALSTELICGPQPYTSSLIVESLIELQPWFGTKSFLSVTVTQHNCSVTISDENTSLRDCSSYIPPVQALSLQNDSLCFRGVAFRDEDKS